MRHTFGVAAAGGLALIVGALSFVAVFAYLAARFSYPDILDGPAEQVLPRLLTLGSAGRAVWAVYALLPLAFIPAGAGAFHALRHVREGTMRTAMLFASLSAIAMMLGLMRWPSLHWELARAFEQASPPARESMSAVFAGLNVHLGNYIGEFLGELSLNLFFLLSALTMLKPTGVAPRWLALVGIATAVAGMVGMFRNVADIVAPVAAVNNYLLPIWMVLFGAWLIRRPQPAP